MAMIIKNIQKLEADADPNSTQEQETIEAEKEYLEVLLAFLWASEQGLLSQVTLDEMPESPHLNHQCELVMNKIRKSSTTNSPTDAASGLAVATTSLMLTMTSHEATRVKERLEDKSKETLIRNLGPRQQGVFLKVCTDNMRTPPKMPEFLKMALAEKTPHKATNLIVSETRNWKGSFSMPGFHRFLANGFLSQEENRSEPGGFTGFMFHPRTLFPSGPSATAVISSKERIREFFDLPTDESTLVYYQKKDFFIPKDDNELKIVIQTWHDLLVLMSVKDTIAAEGLAHFLDAYDGLYSTIQEMFVSCPNFGLIIVLTLDCHLQSFFEMISELDDVTKATSYQREFLRRRADKLIEELENKRPPTILIPQCLLPTVKLPKAAQAVDEETTQRREKKRARESEGSAERGVHLNKEAQPDWAIPKGKTYMTFFSRASPNQKEWPRMNDPRHSTLRSMCCRFHAKGQCTTKCSLAHVVKSKMTDKEEVEISARFKTIYGK
jgi:hypothetical protein